MAQRTTQQANAEVAFYRQLCLARYVEGLVAAVLELSGYVVFPLGYEQFMPVLRHLFRGNQADSTATEARLRSSPDLLVVGQTNPSPDVIPYLVEVKYRNWRSPQDVRLRGITQYQQHWPDALLVVVIQGGAFFYAQQVARLKARRQVFDLTREFRRLDAFFPRVQPDTQAAFAQDIKRLAVALE
jgi:hypothetical protein